jgi:hypothetical protein
MITPSRGVKVNPSGARQMEGGFLKPKQIPNGIGLKRSYHQMIDVRGGQIDGSECLV